MRISIMQPYFFPYIGYFQMLFAVDKFIFYDDVQYIQRGWINRNYILSKEGKQFITIPVKKHKLSSQIKDIKVANDKKWKNILLRKFELTYRKTPHFNSIHELFVKVIDIKSDYLIDYCTNSIYSVLNYLELKKKIEFSSNIQYEKFDKVQKINSIVSIENAKLLILPQGSTNLYEDQDFVISSFRLIPNKDIIYTQFTNNSFVPDLSILDILVFCDKDFVQELLMKFTLE